MVYGGKTLTEIAGYTPYQLHFVICRRRDKYGKLLRGGDEKLPPWVEVDEDGFRKVGNPSSFGRMYRQVKQRQGLDAGATEASLATFLQEHPPVDGLLI